MSSSAMRKGLSVLKSSPGAVLAEIVWRWTFGATMLVLCIISFHQYFSTIEISQSEYQLMKSLEPFTWVAISMRVLVALMTGLRVLGPILIPSLSILWVALATVGRAVSVRVLVEEDARTNWTSLTALNAFRLLLGFASVIAYFGVGAMVSRVFDPTDSFAVNVVVMGLVFISLSIFASIVNWYFSTAAIFASRDHSGVLQSLRSAEALQGIGVVNVWFVLMRLGLIACTSIVSLMMVGPLLHPGHRLGSLVLLALITLVYFAISDALYIWRVAAYIALTESESTLPLRNDPNARTGIPGEPVGGRT